MTNCLRGPSRGCCHSLVADTLCCKLVELFDLDIAQIEKKADLFARIMKNSVQKIYCPLGPWKPSNLRYSGDSQFDERRCFCLGRRVGNLPIVFKGGIDDG